MISLGIVGSRDFEDYELFKTKVVEITRNHHYEVAMIVSGGAKGSDSLAKRYSEEHRIPFQVFEADWNIFGKSAGVMKNSEIVNRCDVMIAFWMKGSSGTMDSIKKSVRGNKPTFIITIENDRVVDETFLDELNLKIN